MVAMERGEEGALNGPGFMQFSKKRRESESEQNAMAPVLVLVLVVLRRFGRGFTLRQKIYTSRPSIEFICIF